ncbi:hypothetical protein [Amycolatopsis sp. H20-H5]|uniref:hypothetical protein n=1 Tax=Amycolatopsis sp. H20-H5 TaxID=3046309 RepID=UPI002DB8CC57|nr:hypothetical protein [Amycolatopsis sp. H20-H5]MEC3981448.1 hypothetical protein [Amycolatopsis sp. H20-H5]
MPPKHSSDAYGSGPSQGAATPVNFGDNAASDSIVSSARGRDDGFDVGTDRAIVDPPNWAAKKSQELYDGAVQNNDPGTADRTSQIWNHHSGELDRVSNDLYTAISELGNAWVGEGAASAQGTLVAIANSSSQASQASKAMSERLARQAAAATRVKTMPPPKPDPSTLPTAHLTAPIASQVNDQKVATEAYDSVLADQIKFMDAYTQEMKEIDGTTPSFGPESLGLKPSGSHHAGSFGNVGGPGSHFGGVGSTGGGGPVFAGSGASFDSNGSGGSGGRAGSDFAANSGTFSQSGSTATAGANAPGVGAGATTGAGSFSGAGAAAVPAATSGGGGGGVGQALGAGALGGGLGLAGGRALGQGNRSGARPDSTEAASHDAAGQSAASANAPQQGVVSPGGTIGSGQTPPAPMGGMGGMGGGHGAHAEPDEEHTHASFLIEPDPDDTFGANEATPPPVIGAWDDEDNR